VSKTVENVALAEEVIDLSTLAGRQTTEVAGAGGAKQNCGTLGSFYSNERAVGERHGVSKVLIFVTPSMLLAVFLDAPSDSE
jgi:hypothetical protein